MRFKQHTQFKGFTQVQKMSDKVFDDYCPSCKDNTVAYWEVLKIILESNSESSTYTSKCHDQAQYKGISLMGQGHIHTKWKPDYNWITNWWSHRID